MKLGTNIHSYVSGWPLLKRFSSSDSDVKGRGHSETKCSLAAGAYILINRLIWRKLLCQKISYATYLLLMTQKNFLRYDNRGCTTQLQ